jgi:transforming growth factor-beta-induced protein
MNFKKDGSKILGAVLAVLVLLLAAWWLMQDGSMTVPGQNQDDTTTTGSNTGSGTVAAIAASVSNGGRYNQLLAQSGVLSAISGKGPYTVFVATDGAYSRLIPGTINNMTPAELKRTMQYSVVSGKKLDVDAINNSQIQALSRDTLNFRVDANKNVYVNSGQILKSYKATNGMVYVINAVLIPPKQ